MSGIVDRKKYQKFCDLWCQLSGQKDQYGLGFFLYRYENLVESRSFSFGCIFLLIQRPEGHM